MGIRERLINALRVVNPLPEDVALVAELLTIQQRTACRLEQKLTRIESILERNEMPDGSEEIVELPYAMAAAGELSAGSRILDVSSTRSMLAFSLASLGYEVTALDVRPYPLQYPNLTIAIGRIEDWSPGDHLLDAIFCLSTIEHFASEGHTERAHDSGIHVMRLFREWLKPGGTLVLSLPFGRGPESNLGWTFDTAQFDTLLDGWDVRDRRVFAQTSTLVWQPWDSEPSEGTRGVALVKATRA